MLFAVVELAYVSPTTLHLDRMLGLEIDSRRDDFVTMKILAVTVAANTGFRGRQSCDAYAD
jgi:hypothetical protein